MKILIINKFLFPKGGDSVSALSTGRLLSQAGHKVVYWGMDHPNNSPLLNRDYLVSNRDYNGDATFREKLRYASDLLYSKEAKYKVEKFINITLPDIVHLNNFAHQISPSILDVFKKYKIPCVMTMHDYKLVCASYLMINRGKICEKCRNAAYYKCISNRCVKESILKSALSTVEMYCHHRLMRIYRSVRRFIAPSRFMIDKIKDMGFMGNCDLLPNFIDCQNITPEFSHGQKAITFVGRLSKEKGLGTLLDSLDKRDSFVVNIVGEGPLKNELEWHVKRRSLKNVFFHGFKRGPQLENIIKSSRAIVLPSICYENCPMSLLEAFAFGKMAIGSRIGGIPEIIKDGISGLTFEAGNSKELRDKILQVMDNSEIAIQMGKNARQQVESENSPNFYYVRLTDIYRSALSI